MYKILSHFVKNIGTRFILLCQFKFHRALSQPVMSLRLLAGTTMAGTAQSMKSKEIWHK